MAVVLVGASIFCSLLVQYAFTQQSELPSEMVCWTILPFLVKFRAIWPEMGGVTGKYMYHHHSEISSLWLIATSLVISSVYKAENGIIELLVSTPPLEFDEHENERDRKLIKYPTAAVDSLRDHRGEKSSSPRSR